MGMQSTRMGRPVGEVLAEISTLLDDVDMDCALLADADRLGLVGLARQVAGRVQALAAVVAADAEAGGVCERAYGTPLASWLTGVCRLTRAEAHRLLGQGRALSRFPEVGSAVLTGAVGVEQAGAITSALGRLPEDFSSAQVAEAEAAMVGFAAEFDSAGLTRLSGRLVEVLDPAGCEAREGRRLERELRQARAARFVTFTADGEGSVLLRGRCRCWTPNRWSGWWRPTRRRSGGRAWSGWTPRLRCAPRACGERTDSVPWPPPTSSRGWLRPAAGNGPGSW
jgi:Domain of unknown function (DUF222)